MVDSTQSPLKSHLFVFLAEIDKPILKFLWKCKGPRTAKTILKNKVESSQFQNLLPIKTCGTGIRIDIYFTGNISLENSKSFWVELRGIRIFPWRGHDGGLSWSVESVDFEWNFWHCGQGYGMELPARCHYECCQSFGIRECQGSLCQLMGMVASCPGPQHCGWCSATLWAPGSLKPLRGQHTQRTQRCAVRERCGFPRFLFVKQSLFSYKLGSGSEANLRSVKSFAHSLSPSVDWR